jgi:hypothetical protein
LCFYRKERQANSDYGNAKNAKDLPESSFATFAEALIQVFAVFAVRPLRKTQDGLFETALVDCAEPDGAVLIKNDLFSGATIEDGKVRMPGGSGIGVRKL